MSDKDTPCEICGYLDNQDHTVCFEVRCLRENIGCLKSRVRELEAELGVWENREKFWDDKTTALEAERDRLKEDIENPKMTYCAFCGEAYDIQDREKALELITEHVSVCPKHPIAELRTRHAGLVEALKEIYAISNAEKALVFPDLVSIRVYARKALEVKP